jgi:hypothetical protein
VPVEIPDNRYEATVPPDEAGLAYGLRRERKYKIEDDKKNKMPGSV